MDFEQGNLAAGIRLEVGTEMDMALAVVQMALAVVHIAVEGIGNYQVVDFSHFGSVDLGWVILIEASRLAEVWYSVIHIVII